MARPKDLNLEHAWRQRLHRQTLQRSDRSPSSAHVRASPVPRSTPGNDGSRRDRFPHGLEPPLFVPLHLGSQPTADHPAVGRGVEIDLPHQVRLRFDAPPEPEWLGRLVTALADLPSQEASS